MRYPEESHKQIIEYIHNGLKTFWAAYKVVLSAVLHGKESDDQEIAKRAAILWFLDETKKQANGGFGQKDEEIHANFLQFIEHDEFGTVVPEDGEDERAIEKRAVAEANRELSAALLLFHVAMSLHAICKYFMHIFQLIIVCDFFDQFDRIITRIETVCTALGFRSIEKGGQALNDDGTLSYLAKRALLNMIVAHVKPFTTEQIGAVLPRRDDEQGRRQVPHEVPFEGSKV